MQPHKFVMKNDKYLIFCVYMYAASNVYVYTPVLQQLHIVDMHLIVLLCSKCLNIYIPHGYVIVYAMTINYHPSKHHFWGIPYYIFGFMQLICFRFSCVDHKKRCSVYCYLNLYASKCFIYESRCIIYVFLRRGVHHFNFFKLNCFVL